MRIKSPGYPNINIQQAIDMAGRIFASNRQNAVDREAAAKDLGYAGITGQSTKMLANLGHFGLIEKTGKGGIRVTDVAVRLLHPRDADERTAALIEAAYSPELFAAIKQQWPDGFVSENGLSGYLMRAGFSSAAVAPAISSYMETYSYLQQSGATESRGLHAHDGKNAPEARLDGALTKGGYDSAQANPPALATSPPLPAPQEAQRREGAKLMEGERVVFVEEGGPDQYLKVIASGALDGTLLEALEDYIKRQKKRLNLPKQTEIN